MHNTPLMLFPQPSETIEGTARALRAGETTCAAVLEHCFHQIDLWDERVKAWVFVDRAGAMKQARSLDEQFKAGNDPGPLAGIPFGIKDIIDVAGMPTACGFPPWRDRVAKQDADVVKRLREAGAVILGKTVTTQFAWVDPPPTRNPWKLDRTPGGSSSGSAAAVATGMCLGAIGTQTGGSIIRPASFCGVVGLKPSWGTLSVEGVFPFAPTLDHVGPIGRTVADVQFVMAALAGVTRASGTSPSLAGARPDADPTAVAAPQLFRPRGFYDRRADPEMLDVFEKTLERLVRDGAEVSEFGDDVFDFESMLVNHRTIMAAEAAAQHESIIAEHRHQYSAHIRALVDEGQAMDATRYVRAQLLWREAEFLGLFHEQTAPSERMAIVTPAAIGPAPDAETTGNPCFNSPWSFLGWPAVTVPMCLSEDGLPLGLQLVGPPATGLLPIAAWCESRIHQASLGHRGA